MNNLIAYSFQVGAVVIAAAFVPRVFGIRLPGAKLLYWQALLAACLALPLVRPWKEAAAGGAVTVSSAIVASNSVPHHAAWSIAWNTFRTDGVFLLLAAGVVARLLWLIIGFVKLRRLRLQSKPLEAGVWISDEIVSPVTFGLFRPVILVPAGFPDLAPSVREAILCHERMHVRRRDWLFTVVEELIRAALWFHPAIWWVLGEIQLAREQVVDEAVIQVTQARERYVDALLAIAGAEQPDLAPAPLFLRKRHLKQRVVSILKEVRMSKVRSFSALAAALAMMAGLCWFVSGAIPLIAQMPSDDLGVSVDTGGAELMHRTPVSYPPAALAAHIEGTVVIQAILGPTGAVREATAVSGPDELRNAAVQSVRQWHFVREASPSQQIGITFHVPSDANLTVKDISIVGLSDRAASQLRAQLPVHEGETITPELLRQIAQSAAAFDEHLTVHSRRVSDTAATIVVSPVSISRIRIGGNVQQANLLTQVVPKYPPDAKAARVQGVVKLEVDVGPEGKVEDVRVVSGPPLLVQAAMEAVKQWTYKPTLLNGNPVAVMTTVDVNFTLAQ